MRRLKVKKPVRFTIYVALLAFAWFMLSPALTINTAQIGAPIKALLGSMNTLAMATAVFGIALVITFMITSGWGLILLGALALVGLIVVSVLHPYLFPLLIPLFTLWLLCAAARRRENASTKAASSNHA